MEVSDYINVVSIDPGNNIGLCIYSLDPLTLKIVNIETKLFVLNNIIDTEDEYKTLHRLQAISNVVKNIMYVYKPMCLAFETSFLNMRFPKAVIQLSQYVGTIELTAYECNPYIKMFRYMPKYIKKNIGAGGNADKDDMTVAISVIKDITEHVNIKLLSEHEVDSLAIGYLAVEEIRKFPFLLYAL